VRMTASRVIDIRPYVDSDRGDVIELLIELQAFERQFSPYHVEPDRAFGAWYLSRLLETLRKSDGVLLVATDGVRACGFTAGYAEEDFEARDWYFYIAELAVADRARGSGIGTRLVQAMEDVARSRGLKRADIGVLAGSDRVHALYRRLGFRDFVTKLRKTL
jgi:ribosomal protein S18 acetylase RimI-like enzyme